MRWNFLREKAIFMIFVIVCAIFTVYLIQPVTAQEENYGCCELTQSGEGCRYAPEENCKTNSAFSQGQSCEATPYCEVGCCISTEGTCSKGVSKGTCEALQGYTWDSDENCALDQCQIGCCSIGTECFLTTQTDCKTKTNKFQGLDLQYYLVKNQQECQAKCETKIQGCCATDICEYTTQDVCINYPGEFFENTYCSNPQTECGCESQSYTQCIEGTDDVYWFDSCGNQEGIADYCDYEQGTLCGLNYNTQEYECRNVNCEETFVDERNVHDVKMGGERQNGEAWCVYESPVGEFRDRPGSQHYRMVCMNGEEILEPCRDYRQEICLQHPMYDDGVEKRGAQCMLNDIYDSAIDSEASSVTLGNLWDDSSLVQTCDEGSYTCPVMYLKPSNLQGWSLAGNSQCTIQKGNEGQLWTDNMVERCRSAGDCGTAHSINLELSEQGFFMSGEQNVEIGNPDMVTQYYGFHQYAEDVSNEKIESWKVWGVFGKMRSVSLLLPEIELASPDFGEVSNAVGFTATGVLAGTVATVGIAVYAIMLAAQAAAAAFQAAAEAAALAATLTSTLLPSMSATLSASAAGASAAATTMATTGTIAGAAATIPIAGWVVAAVAVVVGAIITALSFTGEKKEIIDVVSNCQPWIPPEGGDYCDLCDVPESEGGLALDINGRILEGYSCTEYKCKSLGTGCEFIEENLGTGRPLCYYAYENDVNAPTIKMDEVLIAKKEYQVKKLSNGYEILDDLEPYKKFEFGIVTDDQPQDGPTQCKFTEELPETDSIPYEQMTSYFPTSAYEKYHNASIVLMPDKEYTFYVSCKDKAGNSNIDLFVIKAHTKSGPDLEPPYIEEVDPPTDQYVKYDSAFSDLIKVNLDEPAECKWSTKDQDYELMENEMACNSPPQKTSMTYNPHCLTAFDLTNITEDITYYFRCRDYANNTNAVSYEYNIFKSKELLITQTAPSGELFNRDVVLQVVTAGGAEEGKAECSLGSILFLKTGETIHEQPLMELPPGEKKLSVLCEDKGENYALALINFTIAVDEQGPRIIGIKKDGNSITIVLDEQATCQYSNEEFFYGEGTTMGTDSIMHTASGEEEYNIICIDESGNKMPLVRIFSW